MSTSTFYPATTLDPLSNPLAAWPHPQDDMNSDDYDVSSDDGSSSHLHTIAPAALQFGEDYVDEETMLDEEESGYAALEFPDTMYFVKETSLVLGRDSKLQDWLNKNIDSRRNDKARRRDLRRHGSDASAVPKSDDLRRPRRHSPEASGELGTVEGGIGRTPYKSEGTIELANGDAFLPIHTPMDQETGDVPNLAAISKQHLRLRLDEHAGWSMQVLGRNGCMINDDYYHQNDEVELQDGDCIQIADLSFFFRLPEFEEEIEVMDGIEGDIDMMDALEAKLNSRKKKTKTKRSGSTAIESSDDDDDDSAEEARVTKKIPKLVLKHNASKEATAEQTPSETPAGDAAGNDDDSPQKVAKKSKYPMDPNELLRKGEVLPQKRGPGRPPKNGMMSKREMKERLKMMEDERRRLNGEEAMPKSGKSGSRPKMENGDGEKKVKKRRRSGTDADDSKKIKGESKDGPTPGPRTPSPKIEDYTPQQLEKPSSTYAELLYPLLQETGPLSLQEIYRHFEKKWPYYKFGCKGTGWQSSIRHTVNTNVEKGEGHFVKDSKDGKGFKWAANKNNPVPIKPSRVNNTSQTPVYHGAPPNHGHPPMQHTPYGGPHNPGYPPRQYNTYNMHPPGPYSQQHMRPPQQGMPNTAQYPPRPPQMTPQGQGPQGQGPQGQQNFSSPYGQPPRPPSGAPPPPPNSVTSQQPGMGGPRPSYNQPPPQTYQQSPNPGAQQQPVNQAGQQPTYQNSPQQTQQRPGTLVPPGAANSGPGSAQPNQQQAIHGAVRPPVSNGAPPMSQAQGQVPPRPANSTPVHNLAGPATHTSPGPRPQSTQPSPAQVAAPPRRAAETPMSGLECLLRGIRPPVFDDFKKVFLEEQPGVQAGNRERVERQLAQAIDWFMRNKNIDKDHENEPEEIRALIKTLKGLLFNQHKGIVSQRQRRQQQIAGNGGIQSRSSTPVNNGGTTPNAAQARTDQGQGLAQRQAPPPYTPAPPKAGPNTAAPVKQDAPRPASGVAEGSTTGDGSTTATIAAAAAPASANAS